MIDLATVTPNWRLMKSPLNYVIIFLMVAIGLFALQVSTSAIERSI